MAKKVGEKKTKRKNDNPRRTPTNPKGAGRPKATKPLELSEKDVEILASYFLTNKEIAAVLEVHVRTLERNFAAALKRGRDRAAGSIKRKQFQVAIGGNVTMLIWLGKVYLGQREMRDPLPVDEDQTKVVYKTQWGSLDEFGDNEKS